MVVCPDGVTSELVDCWSDEPTIIAYHRNLQNGMFNNAWRILQAFRRKLAIKHGTIKNLRISKWSYVCTKYTYGKLFAIEHIYK